MGRSCTAILTAAFLMLLLPLEHAIEASTEDVQGAKLLSEVKDLLATKDSYAAVEYINSQGTPAEVAKAYGELLRDFYWKEKSVVDLITVGRAGIHYCLIKGADLAKEDPEVSYKLRSAGKAMAYNLASFIWPGWDEPGIVILVQDLEVGLDAAKLNLRLAQELEKGPGPMSAAYWVLGAQQLARREYQEAGQSFAFSAEWARMAGDEAEEWMALGYLGTTIIVEGSEVSKGQEGLDEAVRELERLDTDDSRFYAEQLKTVVKVFTR